MTVEDRLTESLSRHAGSVAPSAVPFDDVVVRAHRQVRRRRAIGGMAAAAAVLIAGGAGVWSATRSDDDRTVTIADEPTTVTTATALLTAAGSWATLPPAPLSARSTPSAVWTGTEFIVWGGHQGSLALSDGAAFDPATGSWRSIASNSWAHPGASAVWDGTEMIVVAKAGGAAYDPATDSWRELPRIDLSLTGGYGLDHVVMAGDDVIGVTFGGPDGPFTRLWRLTDDAWEDYGAVEQVGGTSWDAVGLPDGIAVWNPADGSALLLRNGSDWIATGPPDLPEGTSLVGPVRMAWGRAGLTAVSSVQSPDGTATVVHTLGSGSWSAPVRYDDSFSSPMAQAVPFGGKIAVVGAGSHDPVVLDPPELPEVLAGYPIATLVGQAVATSDDALFVWGGQTISPDGASSDSSPVSAEGAIWTRSAPTPSAVSAASTSTSIVTSSTPDRVVASPGRELDLSPLDSQRGSLPVRVTDVTDLRDLQSARLSTDGRFVIASASGVIRIMDPDGSLLDRLAVTVDPGRTLVDAALGPLDVLYVSESSIDPTTQIQTFRFTAVPTTGSRRGERAISATTTERCVETWCGEVELSSDGVEFTDLGFYVPPELGSARPVWPSLPTLTATAGDTGEMDQSGNFTELTEFVTVTLPDGSVREWRVHLTDAGVAEGSNGIWVPQLDGSVVGVMGSAHGQYLVYLLADGSSVGRMLPPASMTCTRRTTGTPARRW